MYQKPQRRPFIELYAALHAHCHLDVLLFRVHKAAQISPTNPSKAFLQTFESVLG